MQGMTNRFDVLPTGIAPWLPSPKPPPPKKSVYEPPGPPSSPARWIPNLLAQETSWPTRKVLHLEKKISFYFVNVKNMRKCIATRLKILPYWAQDTKNLSSLEIICCHLESSLLLKFSQLHQWLPICSER